SLYQLYSEFGNRDLEPELTTSYEAGIQYLSEKINARVTAFIRDGQDIFLFYSDPVTYASHYINGDKQHDIGFETEAKVQITEAIDVSANYTFTDGEITTNISGSDSSYFNQYKRPKSIVNLSLSWKATEVLSFNASLRAVSKSFEPLYMQPPYELKGFYTLNFYGQY